MDEDVDALLGRAWRDEAARDLLTRLTELDDRMGGHPGERRAADHIADALAAGTALDRVAAAVNVDGAGRFRDLKAYTHGHDALRDLAERVVEGAGQPLAVEETPHPYSDHWAFLRASVSSLQLHSRPATEAATGSDGGERGWGHTRTDTRDKVDRRNLREHAMLTALLVRELTRTDLDRADATALADRLREADAEAGMRAADIWPGEWD